MNKNKNHLKKVIYLSFLIITNLVIVIFFLLTFFNHFEYFDLQIRQKWFLILFFLITGFLLTTYQFNIEGFPVSFNTYIIYFIFFSFDFPITLLFIFIYFILQTAYLIFKKKQKSHLLFNYFYRIPLWGFLILAMNYMTRYFKVNLNQLTSLALLLLSLYLIVHLSIKYTFHTIQHFSYIKINKLKTGFIIILLIDSPLFLYSFIVATAYQYTSFIIPALFTLSLIAFSSLIKLLHDKHLHQRFFSEQLFFLYPLHNDPVTHLPILPAGSFSFLNLYEEISHDCVPVAVIYLFLNITNYKQKKIQSQLLNRIKIIIKMRIQLNMSLFQVINNGFLIIIPNTENKVIKKIAEDITNSINNENRSSWIKNQLDSFKGLYFIFEKEIGKISLKAIYNELQLNIGKVKKNKIQQAKF